MQTEAKEEGEPAKVEAEQDGASAEAPDSPSSPEDLGIPRVTGSSGTNRAALTPPPSPRCHPWCLLLALTFLLLFLLGSWAVVHLSLGTQGAPFQISAGYDRRLPQDHTATIEPHFTTNCTMGECPRFHVLMLKLELLEI